MAELNTNLGDIRKTKPIIPLIDMNKTYHQSDLVSSESPFFDLSLIRKGENGQVESEVTNISDQLLKLAQDVGAAVVPIPGNLLSALTSSIDSCQLTMKTLMNENMLLRSDLRRVTADVRSLQTQLGMEFYHFPRLPLEIQKLIWNHAAAIPRVHVITFRRVSPWENFTWKMHRLSPSNIRNIGYVCRDAQNAFQSMQSPLVPESDDKWSIQPGIYGNWSVDTLWLAAQEKIYPAMNYAISCLLNMYDRIGFISKLAICYNEWMENIGCSVSNFRSVMKAIVDMEIMELMLVINCDTVTYCSEVNLRGPERGASQNLRIFAPDFWKDTLHENLAPLEAYGEELNWAMLEEQAANDIREFRAMQDRKIKEYSSFGKTEEDLRQVGLFNYSGSFTPRIRFVEAIISPGV